MEKDSPVEEYLSNEMYHISMDLLVLSILKLIVKKLSQKDIHMTEGLITEIIEKSRETAQMILNTRFELTESVFNLFQYKIWVSNSLINRVENGKFENLTKKFYCSDNNLHD